MNKSMVTIDVTDAWMLPHLECVCLAGVGESRVDSVLVEESPLELYLANEQYKLARLLGDPLGSCLIGVGLVPRPSQLAQAYCHALLHLAQPSLDITSCLHKSACFCSHAWNRRV